jgi:putative ABC transport system permease protein
MSLISATLGFALRRAWHRRAILLPIALGVLGMATILCSVPLFSAAATEAALQDALHTPSLAITSNLEIRVSAPPLNPANYSRLSQATTANAQSFLGSDLVNQAPIRAGITSLVIYPPGDTQHTAVRPLNTADLWFFTSLTTAHISLTQGRLPSPAVTPQNTAQGTAYNLDALISPDWATQYDLKLNDTLDLANQLQPPTSFLRVHIVGFFRPKSMSDPAWFNDSDPFNVPISFNNEPLPPLPIMLNEAAFENALSSLHTNQRVDYIWFYYLNLDAITPGDLGAVADHLLALRNYFTFPSLPVPSQSLSYDVLSQLNEVIQDFLQRLFFVTIVTLVAVLPGLALLFLYLGSTGSALIEHSREELTMMKSRGASIWQMCALFLGELLLICGGAMLIAPLLASQAAIILANLAFFILPFSRLAATVAASTPQMYLYASLAAGLAFLTLMIPAIGAIRSNLLTVKRQTSRPRLRSLSLRLGPGLLLVALGAFGYLNIRQQSILFVQNLQGSQAIDWVAAISPTLLLLGAAGLALLVIPPLLAVLDRLVRRLPGVAVSMALRQMAQRPAPYMRLVLLLALTISLGLFTSLFNASFFSNFDERAAYLAGADLRLSEGNDNLPDYDRQAASLQDHLTLLPGALDGMDAFRTVNRLSSPALNFAYVTTLGIDTAKFASLAYWRSDFADVPLARLMQALQRPVSQVETVPALISDQLLHATGAHIGDEIDVQIGPDNGANVVIVGSYHYFPTLDPSQYSLVCDMNRLLAVLNLGLSHPMPNEVWLKLAPNAPLYTAEQVRQRFLDNPQHKQLVIGIIQAFDRQALADALRDDPLHRSIASALILDFIIALLLSVVGFIFFFYLIARQRSFEFGVLRAMGLSIHQLLGSLGWEQCTLVVLALGVGAPLGYVTASTTLPPLSTDDTGAPLLPPLATRLNLAPLIEQGILLLICLIIALGATSVIFRRLRVQEVLRLGEE